MKFEKNITIVVLGILFSYGIVIYTSEAYGDNAEELIVTITSSTVSDGTQVDLEFSELHVNYEITATQDGKIILKETAHSMEMTASHQIDAVGSDESPIDVSIISLGIGLPGDSQNWTDPVGTVATKQIVSELGTVAVWVDKDVYYSGESVTISGHVKPITGDNLTILVREIVHNEFPTVLSFTKKPDTNGEYKVTFSTADLNQGNYNVKVVYGKNKLDAQTAFEFQTITIQDNVPPLILTPSDISVETVNQYGTAVTYSVKAIDDVDGVTDVSCRPFSGSTFPLGKSTVFCHTADDAGNSATKSFVVTVKSLVPSTPDWVKNVAGFWCSNEIDDASFVEAIQYLIENNVISVPSDYDSSTGTNQSPPEWIKNNACWWSENLISDDEFASGLEYLIEYGIVAV